jgi:hypothetical protein
MSFEKPPTTPPMPEKEAQKTPNPEEVKNQEKAAEQAGASENTASVLNPENKSFFERMSDGGGKNRQSSLRRSL